MFESATIAKHHTDIVTADSASHTILTIHWNLCMGTIGMFAKSRPDLQKLLAELEAFNICGEFMLTEIGHGLDARSLETSATMLADGSFDLHTPTFAAAKAMPPAGLSAGMARIAVVFARLLVAGDDRGIRPFVVRINEVGTMCSGITSKMLPKRAGATPLDHSVTFFHHAKLPSESLLGSLDKPKDERLHFLSQLRRVTVGSLALSMFFPAALGVTAYITGGYSQRRHVSGSTVGDMVPIISFRTQHRPILQALAYTSVFSAFSSWAQQQFMQQRDPRVAHGIAAAYKTAVVDSALRIMNESIDRLGWQGLFSHSTIIDLMMSGRGNVIAEGDTLVLCIRLASELMLDRYRLPGASDSSCYLARHEAALMDACRSKLAAIPGGHRSEAFNSHILPRCRPIVEAIGQRMAYEAAVASGNVRPALLQLFEVDCMLRDAAWVGEHASLSKEDLLEREASLMDGMMPYLDVLLEETNAQPFASAAIMSDRSLREFVSGLPTFSGGQMPLASDGNEVMLEAKL